MTSLLIKMNVIRCSVNAGLKFRGTKLSRMAVEPRKPRKFSTAKIKVHTVVLAVVGCSGVGALLHCMYSVVALRPEALCY